jgi:hypothetical protein
MTMMMLVIIVLRMIRAFFLARLGCVHMVRTMFDRFFSAALTVAMKPN